MPFVVTELIEDEDYDPLFQIQYKAFINEPAFVALYPGGLDPSARSQNTARFRASLGFSDPQVAVAKVYDDQNGQICAFATMRIYGGNPFSGAEDSDVKFPHVDGDKRVWLEWLFNTKNDRRRKFKKLQVPGSYCYLVALGTDPSRQREGAATLLLDWAVTVMDKKGSRAMLEASRIAVQYGLYEKQDFRAIDTHTYVDKGRFPDMGTGLERNVPTAWTHDNDFASHNRTTWDNAWKTVDADIGVIAISDNVVAEKELHPSQRWPWDSSKGLYLLHGYHNLHCLTILRTALVEMHDKVPQSLHFSHINHCLDAFRQDIICNADDTPRYTGLAKSHSDAPSSGIGQVRMCKDWGRLEKWAVEHSACYKYKIGTTTEDGIPRDRFKYCPDGNKPWEALGPK